MAFKIKRLNHTPQWYRAHCRAEDGGYPAFRAMLKKDMAFIGADNDSHLCYQEKIGPYEERWNLVLSNWKVEDPNGVLTSEMTGVMEREAMNNHKPSDQFEDEPFTSIDRLMTDAGLDAKTVHEYLRWRSRRRTVAAREVPTVVEPAHENQAKQKSGRLKRQNPFFG